MPIPAALALAGKTHGAAKQGPAAMHAYLTPPARKAARGKQAQGFKRLPCIFAIGKLAAACALHPGHVLTIT